MKTAYHYTGWLNWQRIQREGLVPYPIDHPSVVQDYGLISSVWVWHMPQIGIKHTGNILFQVQSKAETHVVKLEVKYNEQDRTLYPEGDADAGQPIMLFHTGHFQMARGDKDCDKVLVYHKSEPALLLRNRIGPEQLTLMGDYDLLKLFEHGEFG